MKVGRSLNDLAAELTRIEQTKKDYLVPLPSMRMSNTGRLGVGLDNPLDMTDWANSQLASWAGIPQKYYDRLRSENPFVLAENVNHSIDWTVNNGGDRDRKLVRVLDGRVRAYLSSRYRILDSSDLLSTVLPVMIENNLRVESCELTERRLFLKAVSDKLVTDVKKGDAVQYGIVVSSSDVGSGSIKVEPLIYRLVCANGMIMNDNQIRKYHVGRNMEAQEFRELLSDETKYQEDKTFWMSVRDVVLNSLQRDVFEKAVDKLRIAANEPIVNVAELPKVIEMVSKSVSIYGDDTKNRILGHLAAGGDLTKYGLANAITRSAQDEDDYEKATDLERAGGTVIELPKSMWNIVSVA